MSRINTYIGACASSYAESIIQGFSPRERAAVTPEYRKVLERDCQLKIFNVATITMITAIALVVLGQPALLLLVGGVAASVRFILLRHISQTPPPAQWTQRTMNTVRAFDFILWMIRPRIDAPLAMFWG